MVINNPIRDVFLSLVSLSSRLLSSIKPFQMIFVAEVIAVKATVSNNHIADMFSSWCHCHQGYCHLYPHCQCFFFTIITVIKVTVINKTSANVFSLLTSLPSRLLSSITPLAMFLSVMTSLPSMLPSSITPMPIRFCRWQHCHQGYGHQYQNCCCVFTIDVIVVKATVINNPFADVFS